MLKALDFSKIKQIQSITVKLLTNCKSYSSELDIIPFSGTTPFMLKGFFIWYKAVHPAPAGPRYNAFQVERLFSWQKAPNSPPKCGSNCSCCAG